MVDSIIPPHLRPVEPLNPIIDLDRILEPLPKEREPDRVSPTRYPFTYAYDLIRVNHYQFEKAFPAVGDVRTHTALGYVPSRTEASEWLRRACGSTSRDDGIDSSHPGYVNLCRTLADAYIAREGLVWPDGMTPYSCVASQTMVTPTGRIVRRNPES